MTTNTNEKVWTTKDLIYILMLFLGFGKNFYTDQVDSKDFNELNNAVIQVQTSVTDTHDDLQKFKEETQDDIVKINDRINVISDEK
jgi:aspartate ammonia-lyase